MRKVKVTLLDDNFYKVGETVVMPDLGKGGDERLIYVIDIRPDAVEWLGRIMRVQLEFTESE